MTEFDKVIPPGSEGKVRAAIDISHIKGLVEKGVDLETNDPETPRAKLSIKANVKTVVEVGPTEQIRFSVSKGETQSVDLTLVPSYEKPLKLTNAVVDSDMFTAKLEPPTSETSKEYKLKVTISEKAKIGNNQRATVKIALQGDAVPVPEITIPIVANVRGPISWNPPIVSFQIRNIPEEVGVDRTVNVRQTADVTAPVIFKAKPGTTMRVLSGRDDWYQVIVSENKVGWVNKKVVKTTKEPQKNTSQTIVLRKSNGNFKILDYSTTIQDLKVEMDRTTEEKNHYNIRVSLPGADRGKKQESGKIVIKTNDSEQPELTIPVYIYIS